MNTRSQYRYSFWYGVGALLLFGAIASAWVGYRLWVSTKVVRELPIAPENALVRYIPPPLRDTGDARSLLSAIENSLRYYRRLPPDAEKRFGKEMVPITAIIETLEDVRTQLAKFGFSPQFFSYLSKNYVFYKTAAERTLVTGYYEAEVEGSYVETEEYRYPLYAPPTDLVRIPEPAISLRVGDPAPERVGRLTDSGDIVPYYSRREIDGDAVLRGRGLELVYLKDPVARFFLHIQGSGVVKLPDGDVVRLGFAEKNGLAYRPIGRLLVERGILSPAEVTMQSIREYLTRHPDEQQEIFNYDSSYVFFRFVEEGPIGNIGVPLTPYRTIATDSRIFPNGALAFLITELPGATPGGQVTGVKRPFNGLVLNQDTGGAIRGPGRVDLFTGRGAEHEAVAGLMKQSGVLYFLLKKKT